MLFRSAAQESFTRTPTGAGSRRQGKLHPGSYGSRVPPPRKASPGLLREPGSAAKKDFARAPEKAGLHPLLRQQGSKTVARLGHMTRSEEREEPLPTTTSKPNRPNDERGSTNDNIGATRGQGNTKSFFSFPIYVLQDQDGQRKRDKTTRKKKKGAATKRG